MRVTAWYLGLARLGPGVSWAVRGDHQEQDPVTCNMARLTQGGIQKVFSSILISTHKLNNIETINDSQESIQKVPVGSSQQQTHLLVHV